MATSHEHRVEPPGVESRVYVAGALALTDPGPAAAGVVVLDHRGRMISHRAYYLGNTGGEVARVRALLAGLRLARQLELPKPRFYLEDTWLAQVMTGGRPLPPTAREFASALHDLVEQLPSFEVETISPAANPARAVALAPLLEWLPERTRRAERLHVRQVGEGLFEVESERQPGVVYRVHVPPPDRVAAGEFMRCECPDYQWRGIPCKHLLVVAAEAGGRERLFYPEAAGGKGIPGGPSEAAPEEGRPRSP